jgi:hypothetical protein
LVPCDAQAKQSEPQWASSASPQGWQLPPSHQLPSSQPSGQVPPHPSAAPPHLFPAQSGVQHLPSMHSASASQQASPQQSPLQPVGWRVQGRWRSLPQPSSSIRVPSHPSQAKGVQLQGTTSFQLGTQPWQSPSLQPPVQSASAERYSQRPPLLHCPMGANVRTRLGLAQVAGGGLSQLPQVSVPPQPLSAVPHSTPSAAQVVGVQSCSQRADPLRPDAASAASLAAGPSAQPPGQLVCVGS